MSKHTDGPWSIGHVRRAGSLQSFNEYFVHVGAHGVNGGQGNTIAVVHMGGPGAASNSLEDLEANARLITAAPTLLAALKSLLRLQPQERSSLDVEADIEAAIAKIDRPT